LLLQDNLVDNISGVCAFKTGDTAINNKDLEFFFICAPRERDIKLTVGEHRRREIEPDIFKCLTLGLVLLRQRQA